MELGQIRCKKNILNNMFLDLVFFFFHSTTCILPFWTEKCILCERPLRLHDQYTACDKIYDKHSFQAKKKKLNSTYR